MRCCHVYTAKELQFIKTKRIGRTYQELADMFNRRFGCFVSRASIQGVCYYNGWRCRKTFARIGEERLNDRGFVEVRVLNTTNDKKHNWKKKHHMVWEEAHGKVPKSSVILFINGNKQDCRLENLALVKKPVSVGMIFRKQYPALPNLFQASVLIQEIRHKINQKSIRRR